MVVPYRKIIKEGKLQLIKPGEAEGKEKFVILCSDLMIITDADFNRNKQLSSQKIILFHPSTRIADFPSKSLLNATSSTKSRIDIYNDEFLLFSLASQQHSTLCSWFKLLNSVSYSIASKAQSFSTLSSLSLPVSLVSMFISSSLPPSRYFASLSLVNFPYYLFVRTK